MQLLFGTFVNIVAVFVYKSNIRNRASQYNLSRELKFYFDVYMRFFYVSPSIPIFTIENNRKDLWVRYD